MKPETIAAVAEFLGLPEEDLLERNDNYLQHQLARWQNLAPRDSADLANYYNDNLYLYELITASSHGLVRLIQPFLAPTSRILDYGSGIGTHGLHFLREGHKLCFVDVPSPHFEFVRWSVAREGRRAEFVARDAAGGLPSGGFDAIFCIDVLEHVFDWRETVALFSRLLGPRGKLFMVVSFREFEDHALHIADQTGLTEQTFQACMTANGFHEVFHRDRPVPLTHPLEPFKVFARQAEPELVELGKLYSAGETLLREGKLAGAERCFLRLLEWNPGDFAAHREMARVNLLRGKIDEAASRIAHATELLPEDATAWELAGQICLRGGNPQGAARKFALAATRWPAIAIEAGRQLGDMSADDTLFVIIQEQAANWRERLALLSVLIGHRADTRAGEVARRLTSEYAPETYPGYLAWKELARLRRETGRVSEAIDILRMLLEHHPGRPWLHFDLSLCHSANGAHTAALKELELEEPLSPSRAVIKFEMAIVYRRQGDLRLAAEHFREAAELMPEFDVAIHEQARTLVRLGDNALAVTAYVTAVRLRPEDGELLLELARTQLASGDPDGTCVTLKKVVRLLPNRADVWYELGLLEAAASRFISSMNCFNQAYRRAPDEFWPCFDLRTKLVLALRNLPRVIGDRIGRSVKS